MSTQQVMSRIARAFSAGKSINWIGPTKWRAWREQAGKDKEQETNKDEGYKEKQKEKKRESDRRRRELGEEAGTTIGYLQHTGRTNNGCAYFSRDEIKRCT